MTSKLNVLFENIENEVDAPAEAYQVTDEMRANELLQSECSEFQQQQQVFFTLTPDDFQGTPEFLIYDPIEAKKDFDQKYHIMLMGSLDSWAPMPHRRNAIVAHANKDVDSESGTTYVAIPFNNTKLGICPNNTLEDSFSNLSINLGLKFEYFDKAFNTVLNIFNNPEGTYDEGTRKLTQSGLKYYDENYEALYTAIHKADQALQTPEGQGLCTEIADNMFNKDTEQNVISILEYLKAKKISLRDMLETLLSPEANKFRSIAFRDFIVGENKQNQVWFNNKCLLVRESAFQQLNFQ